MSSTIIINPVENKDRKFGSTTEYIQAWAYDPKRGEKFPILLTEAQVEVARQRAVTNWEDTSLEPFWSWLLWPLRKLLVR